jgi:hypothetical protein
MPKFYSTKQGALCSRYGTGTYIGASIVVVKGATAIQWAPEEVVAISDEEFAKYSREYQGLVVEGSLVEREPKDFEAWNAKLTASEKQAFAEQAPSESNQQPAPNDASAETIPAGTAAKTES